MILANYDDTKDSDGYIYDAELAERPILFCEKFLKHAKGERGSPFLLADWQKSLTRMLFGWVHPETKKRRYRSCYVEIPRKNGKSTYAAFLAIYMLLCDGEQGAENYIAASDKDQASLIFDIMASMIRQSKPLSKLFKILDSRKRILYQKTNSFLCAIAADAASAHGFNSHLCLYDELHAAPSRELYDVLRTSQGSRKQPLFFSITTAGYDRQSICWAEHEYSRQVAEGTIKDSTHLPVIFAADENDDINSEETIAKANPCYGISIQKDFIQKELRKAASQPAYENTVKRLYFNIWTEAESKFLSMADWNQCNFCIEQSELDKAEWFGGLDLSDTQDLSSLSLVAEIKDKIVVQSFNWIPKEGAAIRASRDKIPYLVWAKNPANNLFLCDGKRIDYNMVQRDIEELCSRYDVRAIAFDRFNASQLVRNLEEKQIQMVPFGQGFVSMSAPTKELERLVVEHRLNHLGNEVLSFCAANATLKTDETANIKVIKPEWGNAYKVDAIIATIQALGLKVIHDDDFFRGSVSYG